jgi:hypothetical protein
MGVASYREDIYLRFLESTERVADAFTPPDPPGEICETSMQSSTE